MNVNNSLQGLQELFPSEATAKAQSSRSSGALAGSASGSGDEARLSPAASVAAQAAPDSDVRMEKVSQVQQVLAAGTYAVPAAAVADRMISHMLGNG